MATNASAAAGTVAATGSVAGNTGAGTTSADTTAAGTGTAAAGVGSGVVGGATDTTKTTATTTTTTPVATGSAATITNTTPVGGAAVINTGGTTATGVTPGVPQTGTSATTTSVAGTLATQPVTTSAPVPMSGVISGATNTTTTTTNNSATSQITDDDIWAMVKEHRTADVEALVKGQSDIVKRHIQPTGWRWMTLLHMVIHWGRVDMVGFILASGAEVNAPNYYNSTPLHLAAQKGLQPVIALLLTQPDTAVNAQDGSGWTALHVAARCDHITVAQMLLMRGADCNMTNRMAETPAAVARLQNYRQLATIIDEYSQGPPPKFATHIRDRNLAGLLLCNLNDIDIFGCTPVHYALICGSVECADLLTTELHCDPNAADINGRSALHYLAGASLS